MEKPKAPPAKAAGGAGPAAKTAAPVPPHVPPLFRRIDWLTFGVTTLLVLIGYILTLAPNLTLEDSGELAVASFYAGIPHPPGYPVWTIYTWIWTVILPFSNIAWRVAFGGAVGSAVACGLLGLLVSRGSSMMMEGIATLKAIDRRWESAICMVSGFVAGMLLGFNGYMWSQSVIVEVYGLSVLSLMGVMLGLLRWVYAPHQHRYLYWAFFMYGICFNNHQSLLVIALGLEILVLVVEPKLARELFFWNSILFVGGLLANPTILTGNRPVLVIYVIIGLLSFVAWVFLTLNTRQRWLELARNFAMVGTLGYLALVLLVWTSWITAFDDKKGLLVLTHLAGLSVIAAFVHLWRKTKLFSKEWLVCLGCGGSWLAGAAFYLYMPLAGATIPPMQWGYPRTLEGFIHALTRGQYERIRPTSGVGDNFFEITASFITTYAKQSWMFLEGLNDEFNLVYLLIALVMFVFYRRMQSRERAWTLGVTAIFACLGPFLIVLLNPPPDRQARELIRVFFTASHVLVAMGVGYGLTLIAASLATHYQQARRAALLGGVVAADLALFALAGSAHGMLGPGSTDNSSIYGFLRFVYILLALACLGLVAVRLYFAEKPVGEQLPLLLGLITVCFLCAFTNLPVFLSPVNGIDATTATGYGKIICWLLTGLCFYLVQRAQRNDERVATLAIGGLLAVVSVGMTLLTLLGNRPGLGGLLTFFQNLGRAFNPGQYAMPLFANLILFGMAVVFLVATFFCRSRAPLGVALLLFAAMPLHSVMSHWFENEQRGHLFGYWFGHDMFTPPFEGPDGKFGWYDPKAREEMMQNPEKAKFIYPEMTRDAVLYGGTDPGRFCPTYTIFCESFIPARCKADTDPLYDRRDVYIITQNALADGTYLNYIRSHYNRSTQIDPPFFQEVLRGPKERELNYETNLLARLATTLLDKPLTSFGAAVEARRRREGVYPPKEMYIATPDDSQRCFHEYLTDAQQRLQRNQLKPGEDVRIIENRVQVSGQVAVMSINGLLTKVMFDKNPTNEFFVEESFPLDWMYPHLTPFGIIMKINRQPLPALTEEILQRDHEFWTRYSERLIGNWITYDTTVKEIVDFVQKTYLRRDFNGFTGDRKFVRDDQAQKAFSKLRSSIGGIYAWRINPITPPPPEFRPRTEAEVRRLYKEADFTFRQAFAFCPYSPEAVFRYINLLIQPPPPIAPRLDDALMIAETCLKLDPYNGQVLDLVNRLRGFRKNAAEMEQTHRTLQQLEAEVRTQPTNLQAAFNLASFYMQMQQTGSALAVLDRIVNASNVQANALLTAAQAYISMGNWPRLEFTLERLVQIMPDEPEAWYDLAALKISLGKPQEALTALARSLDNSAKRLATNPNARDLLVQVRQDARFNSLRQLPEFIKLVPPK